MKKYNLQLYFDQFLIHWFLGNILGDNMSIPPRLKELHNRLVEITTEYQNLLDMFLSFFNSLQEVFNIISTIMLIFSVFKNIYYLLFF